MPVQPSRPVFVVLLYANLRDDQPYLPIHSQDVGRALVELLMRGTSRYGERLPPELLAWRTEKLPDTEKPLHVIAPVAPLRRRVLQGNHRWLPAGTDARSTWCPYPDVSIHDVAICACGRIRRKRIGVGGAVYFQYLKPESNPTKGASWLKQRNACPLDHWSEDPADDDTQALTVPVALDA